MTKFLDFIFIAPLPRQLTTSYLPVCMIISLVSIFTLFIVIASGIKLPLQDLRPGRNVAIFKIVVLAALGLGPLVLYAAGDLLAPSLIDNVPAMVYLLSIVPCYFYIIIELAMRVHEVVVERVLLWKAGKLKLASQALFLTMLFVTIGVVLGLALLVAGTGYTGTGLLYVGAAAIVVTIGILASTAISMHPAPSSTGHLVPHHAPGHRHVLASIARAIASPARSRVDRARACVLSCMCLSFIIPLVVPLSFFQVPVSPLDKEKNVFAFYYAWYANSTDYTNVSTGFHDLENEPFSDWHWNQNNHHPWNFNWSQITFTPPASEAEINVSACNWNQDWLDTAHLPIRGPYDSADPAVLRSHLLACASAGIDTLIVSWNGEYDERDVNAFNNLLAMAELLEGEGHENIPDFTIYFEHATDWADRAEDDYGCQLQDPGFFSFNPPHCSQEWLIARNLAYYVRTWGGHDKVFKVDRKPVIFVWAPLTRGTTIDRWSTIKRLVEQEVGPVFLHGNVGLGSETKYSIDAPLWNTVFDGYHSYILGPRFENLESDDPVPVLSLREIYSENVQMARRAGVNFAATAYPGYEDRHRYVETGGGSYVNRRGTKNYGDEWTYKGVWEDIIVSGARWVVIATFNEWHEGTEIEPSFEYGDFFMNLTRDFVARFKSS